jgi:hypothetical protein
MRSLVFWIRCFISRMLWHSGGGEWCGEQDEREGEENIKN